jgi:hypothetical protein
MVEESTNFPREREEKKVPDRKEENQGKCDFSPDFISLLQTVFSKKVP